VDKGPLWAKLLEAAELRAADYTAASWAAFAPVLANAQAVYANEDATQWQVDISLANLIEAIEGLVRDPAAERAALGAKIAEAALLRAADYTAASWAAFASVLESAEGVYNDPGATAEQIGAALANLTAAMAALVEISVVVETHTFTAQKISGGGVRGGIDGIDADPDVGIHNSYAWCSEVFEQDEDAAWLESVIHLTGRDDSVGPLQVVMRLNRADHIEFPVEGQILRAESGEAQDLRRLAQA
jgi:hypothetical protein